MKKFKNNNSGVTYYVTNDALIKQYESRKEHYTEINVTKKPTSKEEKLDLNEEKTK